MSDGALRLVLCADKHVLIGLNVTLYSALKHTNSRVEIFLIHNGIGKNNIDKLNETLSPFRNRYDIAAKDFDASLFSKLKKHRGNIYAYARLMIGEFLDTSRAIYLDTDLVVGRDLQELYQLSLDGKLFGAVPSDRPETTSENRFFQQIGVVEGGENYFNSGVMLFNLDRWRSEDYFSRATDFASKYGDRLPTMDQTILNYLALKNDFVPLDRKWNYEVRASSPVCEIDDAVLHFLSVPKPWDIGAEFIHKSYGQYEAVLNETAYRGYRPSLDISPSRLKIAARSARGYYRAVLAR